jgi:hypothetical protein
VFLLFGLHSMFLEQWGKTVRREEVVLVEVHHYYTPSICFIRVI